MYHPPHLTCHPSDLSSSIDVTPPLTCHLTLAVHGNGGSEIYLAFVICGQVSCCCHRLGSQFAVLFVADLEITGQVKWI